MRLLDDGHGKPIPAQRIGGTQMENLRAPGYFVLPQMRQRQRCDIGDQCRRGRAADLVIHHAQRIFLARQAQNGFDKVAAMRTEHPARAQDQRIRAARRDGQFACMLAAAIHALR